MKVRTRFAPSPTGYLHIGGVRTALFNWLFARQHGGEFLLRIDDTDAERNVSAALQPILHGFEWLGIDWDEGPTKDGTSSTGPHAPYFQSQRGDKYRAAAEKLLASGHAYRDYADPAEIVKLREAAEKAKQNFVYPRDWAEHPSLPENAGRIAEAKAAGRQAVVRLFMPREGTLVIDDLIRGQVEFQWANESDHVIQRADGTCLYHLASVVDDYDMQISHVIRAEEHLSNTPRQIFIAQSLGYELPRYAHLPYVAEPGSKTKLSKRKLPKYLLNKDFAAVNDHGKKIGLAIKDAEKRIDQAIVQILEDIPNEFLDEPDCISLLKEIVVKAQFAALDKSKSVFTTEFTLQMTRQILEILDNENYARSYIKSIKNASKIYDLIDETFNPVIVDFYEQVGYLPHAIVNYLLLLGWSFDDKTEYFTQEEMIKGFSLERVNKAPASFDPKKLMSFQEHYFAELPAKKKTPRMIDYLKRAGLLPEKTECSTGPEVTKIIEAAGDRLKVYGDILNFSEFFVSDEALPVNAEELTKTFAKPGARDLLAAFRHELAKIEAFEVGPLETALKAFVDARGVKVGELIHPLRLALCGKTVGMGLYDTLAILGKERCLARIDLMLSKQTA